jgi:hypothetical protein
MVARHQWKGRSVYLVKCGSADKSSLGEQKMNERHEQTYEKSGRKCWKIDFFLFLALNKPAVGLKIEFFVIFFAICD